MEKEYIISTTDMEIDFLLVVNSKEYDISEIKEIIAEAKDDYFMLNNRFFCNYLKDVFADKGIEFEMPYYHEV